MLLCVRFSGFIFVCFIVLSLTFNSSWASVKSNQTTFFVGQYSSENQIYQLNLFRVRQKIQLYFGEKYEPITHFGIHFLIATWRPKYSLIAAVSIETADTLGGRFELKDWISRLSGCMAGYLVNRFIFKRR